MLDTDTVSYAIRDVGAVNAHLLKHSRAKMCVSVLTEAELRNGALQKGSPRLQTLIEKVLKTLRSVHFDSPAALQYAQIATALKRAGTPIGQLDMLIAAHAISLNLTLVTNNTAHYSKVPGLRLENWFNP